jgi:ATP-dependent helicase YprA (DUF1998 family)
LVTIVNSSNLNYHRFRFISLPTTLNILGPRIKQLVDDKLMGGALWPDPLIQLSQAYKAAGTVNDLVKQDMLHPLCGQIFRTSKGASLRLHEHQRKAIKAAKEGHNFVVKTETGSGKSLTYMIPIFDNILQNNPGRGKVRAIIVYPMNALINSQEEALNRFVGNLGGVDCPVRYARYTGQESDSKKRGIQNNPPHILLTK